MQIDTLWDNFFTKDSADSIVDFLKSITLFEELKTAEISRLERILYTRHYKKGEVIFREGEPGAALYILKEGEVDITINHDEKPIMLTTLSRGMFFGEMAIFDETPRSATVIASSECEIIALPKPDFILFSEKEPAIGLKIIMSLGRILSIRVTNSNRQIEELKQSHV